MKIYIQNDSENEFASINFFVAYDSFRKMGWEVIPFNKDESLPYLEPGNLVVARWSEVTGTQDYRNF